MHHAIRRTREWEKPTNITTNRSYPILESVGQKETTTEGQTKRQNADSHTKEIQGEGDFNLGQYDDENVNEQEKTNKDKNTEKD